MEEERKQKSSAVAAKKKIEMDFADMEGHLDAANKGKEDAYKQLKKSQVWLCPIMYWILIHCMRTCSGRLSYVIVS